MKSFAYVITDEIGIHARPAGALVKAAKEYRSEITVELGEKRADAKRLMALMGLGARKGSQLTVTVSGEDEEAAAAALEKFFRENL